MKVCSYMLGNGGGGGSADKVLSFGCTESYFLNGIRYWYPNFIIITVLITAMQCGQN
jgi:hypothetical protein